MSARTKAAAPTLRRDGNATVTTGYSAVNFVPTDKIQTSVSYMDGYLVIDTLIPPSRYLPPTLDVTQLAAEMQTDLLNEIRRLGLGKGSPVGAIAPPWSPEVEAEQFVRLPNGELIDPALAPTGHPDDSRRARLGIRSLRGEPLLTYFPTPDAAEMTSVNGKVTTCPCVCCRSHCSGADPRTKRLPVIESALAHDEAGRILLDAHTPLVPPPSTSAMAPREAAVRVAPPTTVPLAEPSVPRPVPTTSPGAPFTESPNGRSVVRLVNGKRETRSVAPHKSLNDLRTTASLQPPAVAERRHLTPPRKVETWEDTTRPIARITVRPSGALSTTSPMPPAAAAEPTTAIASRAHKGASVFAPLQLSDELSSQLVLHDEVTPPRHVHATTPPLSSPSSFTSSRSQRETDSSPGSTYSVDPSTTPIAARYSRSTSNLRQKARERELPPMPPMPTTIPQPIQPVQQPVFVRPAAPAAGPVTPAKQLAMDEYDLRALPPRATTPGGTRVRIVAGNSPLTRAPYAHDRA